jgi:hypothetical protein
MASFLFKYIYIYMHTHKSRSANRNILKRYRYKFLRKTSDCFKPTLKNILAAPVDTEVSNTSDAQSHL